MKKETKTIKEPNIDFDLPSDLPSTVVPFTPHDRQVAELQEPFSGQHLSKGADVSTGLYIWRKADEFIKEWLPNNGYGILESSVFSDCIGYRCRRTGVEYTIFMYAYGKERTTQLDGEYCSKLTKLPFAQDSIALVVYLHVNRHMKDGKVRYTVSDYGDRSDVELWKLTEVEGKTIFEYFPRKEMLDQTWEFVYAFNHEDADVYDMIITRDNPSITGIGDFSGAFLNDAFYFNLLQLHRKYGDMKLGYVRYNDVVYSSVPYIDGVGFFSWSVYRNTERMHSFICHPFDGGERKVAEFIKTERKAPEGLFSHIPALVKACSLPPISTERFAVKAFFDNGECRKYVLPIDAESEKQVSVLYMNYSFTNSVWNSASVVKNHKSRYKGYPHGGSAIAFENGFCISHLECYLNSEKYSEPAFVDEIVYADEKIQIKKLWHWNAESMYEDKETGLLKVLLSGDAFNYNGKSVFASMDGKRLTSLTFDYIDNFEEGYALVGKEYCGYGFVDKDINVVVPLKYADAERYINGKAKVKFNDKWYFIDKNGNEIIVGGKIKKGKYQEVGEFFEGMCKVSTLKLRFMDLAYHSDYEHIAGVWGFINEAGEEVVTPQYIYAHDFEDGIAIVAKGKWTLDPKWNNKHNQGRYWTDEELWGAIDKNGNEVIPCVFDELKHFGDRTDIFMAHYGGWKNGNWGVINRTGEFIVEPVFCDFSYETSGSLIAFYAEDDHDLLGIYDIEKKKIVFEPQFSDVEFLEDGDILVKVFDEELGREVEKIIDIDGNERFSSSYSSIYTWKEPYEVVIFENGGSKHGLIDKNGNVILPCVYDTPWDGIDSAKKLIIFTKDHNQGIKDFDGNIIVPAEYYEIVGLRNSLLTVRVGEKNNYREGLITYGGKQVIPAKFERITWCDDKKHFFCCLDGCCEMYLLEEEN